jgi:hypothetical protein
MSETDIVDLWSGHTCERIGSRRTVSPSVGAPFINQSIADYRRGVTFRRYFATWNHPGFLLPDPNNDCVAIIYSISPDSHLFRHGWKHGPVEASVSWNLPPKKWPRSVMVRRSRASIAVTFCDVTPVRSTGGDSAQRSNAQYLR